MLVGNSVRSLGVVSFFRWGAVACLFLLLSAQATGQQWRTAFKPFENSEIRARVKVRYESPVGEVSDRTYQIVCRRRGRDFGYREVMSTRGKTYAPKVTVLRKDEAVFMSDGSDSEAERFITFLSPRPTGVRGIIKRVWPLGRGGVVLPGLGLLANGLIVEDLLAGSVREEKLANGLIRLTNETKRGVIKMIVDPKHGGLPQSIELIKRSRHTIADMYVRHVIVPTVGEVDLLGGKIWPPGKVREVRYLVEVHRYGEVEGVPYIREWTLRKEVHCVHKNIVVSEIQEGEVESVKLGVESSDRDLLMGANPPNGADVLIEDPNVDGRIANQVHYVWDSKLGWPVPMAPGLEVWVAESQLSRWTKWGGRLGVILLVGGAALYFLKRRSTS